MSISARTSSLHSSTDAADSEFLTKLHSHAKYKQRSHQTHHDIHLHELNARLNLDLTLPPIPNPPADDPFYTLPNLTNTSDIEVVLLGNSMLERFKTTGAATRLGNLESVWNAGCGGDKNENVLYRLEQGGGVRSFVSAGYPGRHCGCE